MQSLGNQLKNVATGTGAIGGGYALATGAKVNPIAGWGTAIGGFGATGFGFAGQISTSTILTRGLTNRNEYGFAVFGGIGLGGAAIKAYWAAGKAFGLF